MRGKRAVRRTVQVVRTSAARAASCRQRRQPSAEPGSAGRERKAASDVRFLVVGAGSWGIGISVFVVIVAALNLVLDFDLIESGAHAGAPKYMEWYGAFALMVTLIWLYLEILRLLSKLRSRN